MVSLQYVIKIDLHNISYFYSNMDTQFHELESGREYYILTSNGKKYKGIFDDYKYSFMSGDRDVYAWFYNETLGLYYYTDDDEFYDVEYIRDNAKRAIQSMENRTLNMILKRLVNEEFQWS